MQADGPSRYYFPTLVCIAILFLWSGGVSVSASAVQEEKRFWTAGLVADNHFDTFPAGERAPWEPMGHWLKGQVERTTTTKKRRYDIARDKMEEAIDVFNRIEHMKFVVNLGDIVNNDMMWNLKPILDSFNKAKAPHFNLLGNHDLRAHNDRYGKDNKAQHRWVQEKFGLGKNGGEDKGDRWYYHIYHPPFIFLFFDSMVMEKSQPDRKLKDEHVDWAIKLCDEAKEKGYAVVIFAHIQIGIETNPMGRVLKHYPHIIAAFFGHDHKGGYIVQRGVHCVTINGQIEMMTNAFAVVEAFSDRMEISGFGRVPSYVLKYKPETTALLQKYNGPEDTDIAAQGYQPAPPEELWRGEVLQNHPPLQLRLPNYKKPSLPASEPNGSKTGTRFLRDEYSGWPKRELTPVPEPLQNLNDLDNPKKPAYSSTEAPLGEEDHDEAGQTKTRAPVVARAPKEKKSSLSPLRPSIPSEEQEAEGTMRTSTRRPSSPQHHHNTRRPAVELEEDRLPGGLDQLQWLTSKRFLVVVCLPVLLTMIVLYRFVARRGGSGGSVNKAGMTNTAAPAVKK